jgi:hypothetical protein
VPAVQSFKDQAKPLESHSGTSYMFLHWNGGKEARRGDYKFHSFVKEESVEIRALAVCPSYDQSSALASLVH